MCLNWSNWEFNLWFESEFQTITILFFRRTENAKPISAYVKHPKRIKLRIRSCVLMYQIYHDSAFRWSSVMNCITPLAGGSKEEKLASKIAVADWNGMKVSKSVTRMWRMIFRLFFLWLLVKIVKSQQASRQMSFSSMCLLSVASQKLCNRFSPLHHSRCRAEYPLRNLLYPEDGENTGSIVRWEHFGEWTTVNLPYFVTNRERKRTNQGKKREAYERFDDKHHAKCAKPLIKR